MYRGSAEDTAADCRESGSLALPIPRRILGRRACRSLSCCEVRLQSESVQADISLDESLSDLDLFLDPDCRDCASRRH
jgi:hypothetical protein